MIDLPVTDVPELSVLEARALTDRIRRTLDDMWDLVRHAYTTRAWQALGYPSWGAYCVAEFEHSRMRLPREQRQQVVVLLREAGLSVRAIAAATSSGVGTVSRDLGRCSKGNTLSRVVGIDGKQYAVSEPGVTLAAGTASRPTPASCVAVAEESAYLLEGVLLAVQQAGIDGWPPDARRRLARVGRQIVRMVERC